MPSSGTSYTCDTLEPHMMFQSILRSAAERAWHKQRRHFGGAASALPPFGVDGVPSAHPSSARCSSFSVSAQSSVAPGSSPVSSTAAPAPASGLDLRHLGTAAGSGGAPDVAADPAKPCPRQAPMLAPTGEPAAERLAVVETLQGGALSAERRLTGAPPGRRLDTMPRACVDVVPQAGAAVQPARTAAPQQTAVLRHGAGGELASAAMASPTAGLSSSAVAEAAARSQRAHVLGHIDNVWPLLHGAESAPTTPAESDVPSGTCPWSWRGVQSPASPCVSVNTLQPDDSAPFAATCRHTSCLVRIQANSCVHRQALPAVSRKTGRLDMRRSSQQGHLRRSTAPGWASERTCCCGGTGSRRHRPLPMQPVCCPRLLGALRL